MKILLITTIYPAPDLHRGTSVCHYFARQWVQLGHEVKVIHIQTVFPDVLHLGGLLFRDRIESRTDAVFLARRQRHPKSYVMDGVSVTRIPVFKRKPHGKYNRTSLDKTLNFIVEDCRTTNFIPDAVCGHFHNPQLELICRLKGIFAGVRTCMIMHDSGLRIMDTYPDNYHQLMAAIDVWGFRSMPIKSVFEQHFGCMNNSFMCYSGLPENFITTPPERSFSDKLKNFVFIGNLIDRKYPETVMDAVAKAYGVTDDCKIVYVGSGHDLASLKKRARFHNMDKIVNFTGRVNRDEVVGYLDQAQCMVMISRNEAFGLVYLEAMSRGCIVIASRNEGMDGIIRDGENGFLCRAGDSDELASVITRINNLSPTQRKTISDNAVATACALTDRNAALIYLNALL